ncbi:histidine kinase [Methylobacterium sp. J-070]|nr:histidine kinase [Methylobacterium sp. J-070]
MFPDDDDFDWVGPDRGWNYEPPPADVFQTFRSPVYTTDAEGWLTYYNEAAADLWGYHPELGKTRWCGCWRIFTLEGVVLPFDQSPIALTLKEGRPLRGAQAILERPDGTRIPFMPYPTPLRDASGTIVAVSNVLVRVSRLNWYHPVEPSADASIDPCADPRTVVAPIARRTGLELDDLTGLLQVTLAALADVEFEYLSDCERIDGWSGPMAERDRILAQLEQKRRRQRDVLDKRAALLERQARRLMGLPPAEPERQAVRVALGGTVH